MDRKDEGMTPQTLAQWMCTAVLFITVIIAGTFAAELTGAWLRNRREERRNTVREAEQRMSARFDRERESWLAILVEKDRELQNMNQMLKRLQINYDIATRVLSVAERKAERKGEEA